MTNTLQKKTYISFFILFLLLVLLAYLGYQEYKGEQKLAQIKTISIQDRNLKEKLDTIALTIDSSQVHFNNYILYREIAPLKAYNNNLTTLAKHLNDVQKQYKHTAHLQEKIKNNVSLNNNLISLKYKTDSLLNHPLNAKKNIALDKLIKPQAYQYSDVLNSVEYETNKKVDSAKKKGFFSRLSSAVKGETEVQKEQINSIIKLKFGKKIVAGDVKQQFKNILVASQKHYNEQFLNLSKNLKNLKLEEKELIHKNKTITQLYTQINNQFKTVVNQSLINNTIKQEVQENKNKQNKFYLLLTIVLLLALMLSILLKYVIDIFNVKKELAATKNQVAADLLLKNKIITTLTHEIKTPISIINLYGSYMANKKNTPELKEFFDTLTYTSSTLMHISNQAVDLIKINPQEIQMHLETIDVSYEAKAIVNSLSIFAQSKNITITFNNQLPASLKMQYDKTKFYQLIYNIVGNAIKFAKTTVTITFLQETEPHHQLVCIIDDDGSGIPPSEIKKIFNLDYQSNKNTTTDKLSFGLGLYLCKNILQATNDTIALTSQENKGTQVVFKIKIQ